MEQTAVSALDEFAASQNLIDAICQIMLQEWGAAYDAFDADCPQGYIAIRAYQEAATKLTKVLRTFGWQRLPYMGQERWQNDADFSQPIQIVISQAKESAGGYVSAPKGTASLDHTGQGAFAFDDLPEKVTDTGRLWVLTQLYTDISPVRIKIVVARLELSGTSKMVIEDSRVLYNGTLVPSAAPAELPQEVPAEVIISEIEIES